MRRHYVILAFGLTGCVEERDIPEPRAVEFSITVEPLASVTTIGLDTLSDSARIHELEPESDGSSVAFIFADAAKGISRGLGILQSSGEPAPQLAWPDSVTRVWWSGSHQLSFIAGTGQGVRVVIDAHAPRLEAVTSPQSSLAPVESPESQKEGELEGRRRAQHFIDSIRVQPQGAPQASTLRYEADSVLMSPTDSIAAVHVAAGRGVSGSVNPTWYLIHLPSGQVRPVDSLVGESHGLAATAGKWGQEGSFYYARDRTVLRVRPSIQ
jgi:hypothetical protein